MFLLLLCKPKHQTMVSDGGVPQTSHLHICSHIDKNATADKSNHPRLLAPKNGLSNKTQIEPNIPEYIWNRLGDSSNSNCNLRSSLWRQGRVLNPLFIFPLPHWMKRKWKRDEGSMSNQPPPNSECSFRSPGYCKFACVTTFVSSFHCLLVMPPVCKYL